MSLPNKIGITVFADGALPDGHAWIEVFHDWIRRRELDELMIDVADYGHVRGGPSVYFCGHESDYAIRVAAAGTGERGALVYRRKRAPAGATFDDDLRRVGGFLARLAKESKLAGASFDRSRFVVGVYDRLAAPNTDAGASATIEALLPLVSAKVGAVEIARVANDPRAVLELEVRAASPIDWAQIGAAAPKVKRLRVAG